LVLCLTIGALSTIGYFLLGLQFWLALGILAGITEIIPFIGPFLGGGTAVAIAFTESWQKALAVAIFAVVLQQLEGAFLVPRIMRNAVGMTPLTVILAVLVGGSLGGPLGAVLAIPVGAAVQVLVQDLLRSRAEATDSVLRNLDDWSSVVPPDVDELPRPNLRTRSVNDHAQVSPASVDSSPVTR
jgi:predicted PurR-regulated permease PerM